MQFTLTYHLYDQTNLPLFATNNTKVQYKTKKCTPTIVEAQTSEITY